MDLGMLVLVVGTGIALIVGVVHFTGGTAKKSEKQDPGEAIMQFGKAFPGLAIRSIKMTADGSAVFFRIADGKTGLLQSMGRHYTARLIEPGMVTVSPFDGKPGLAISFRETGFVGGDYLFSNQNDAAEVSLWLCGSFALAGREDSGAGAKDA